MKLQYYLSLSDFLEYQLYTSSKSQLHKKKRFRSRVSIPILYFLIGLFLSYQNNDITLVFVFSIVSILWFLFYPMYSKWRYKKYFLKYIKENYKKRINKEVELIFKGNHIYGKDVSSETKINSSEIKELIEIKSHFFIKFKTDISLIIPKHCIQNQEEFKKIFSDLKVGYINEITWKWK